MFYSQEDYDAHQDELFNDHLSPGGRIYAAIAGWASFVGADRKDCAWLCSDYDIWVRNPHYAGRAVPHPEADDYALEGVAEVALDAYAAALDAADAYATPPSTPSPPTD